MYWKDGFAKRYSAFVLTILIVMASVLHPWAYVTVDMGMHSYADSAPYRVAFEDRMNCYGYAIHVYSYGRMGGGYLQYPGEFNDKGETHSHLFSSYMNAQGYWNNMESFMNDRIIEDFDYLNRTIGGFNIAETTFSAVVPSGKRKIALVIMQEKDRGGYHFYSRDSNGIWSHKNEHEPVTNLSFDTRVVITDNNFETVSKERQFDDGVRYYLIDKPYIIDYGHEYVPLFSTNATYTPLLFHDGAGATLDKSNTVAGDVFANFDYSGDIDCYRFTPTTSSEYRIVTRSGSGGNTDIVLYDSDGFVIDSDLSSMDGKIEHFLSAHQQYYFRIVEYNNKELFYMRSVYRV